MSRSKKAPLDADTILVTLDQIGHSIDAMTEVVNQLRQYLDQNFEDEVVVDFEFDEDGAPLHEREEQLIH
jgi:hypothetical protein